MAYNWNIADYKLMNERKKVMGRWKNEVVFNDVYRYNKPDKITFVDSIIDGKLTRIIEAVKAYINDVDTIKKDSWGYPKANSLNAWIKRNKFDDVIDTNYNPGQFRIFGMERKLWNAYEKFSYDNLADLVDEAFNRTLHHLADEEEKHFKNNDTYAIKFRAVREHPFTGAVVDYGYSSSGKIFVTDENDNRRNLTIEDMDKLLEAADKIKEYAEKVRAEFEF